MLLRITLQTLREIARPRLAAILVAGLAASWLLTCLIFAKAAEKDSVSFWNLESYWQETLEEWLEPAPEGLNPDAEHRSPHGEAYWSQVWFGMHLQLLTVGQSYIWIGAGCLAALLLSTVLLDRLFRRGELALYLVRPLDAAHLLWGRFLGIYLALALFGAVGKVIVLAGGVGADWREALPIVLLAWQTELAVFLPVLALAFLAAPLTGKLFRGAGTFLVAGSSLFLAAPVPAKAGFLEGLLPFRFLATDPLKHKLLVVFQDLFMLPVPRVFAAVKGLHESVDLLGDFGWVGAVSHAVQDDAGYWWWSVGSGLVVLLVAQLVWWRREAG